MDTTTKCIYANNTVSQIKVRFRSTAPDNTINAISSSWGKHGGSPQWWKRHRQLKAEFDRHGSLDKRFTDFPKDIQIWRMNTLESQKKGHLSLEQLKALKDIQFFKARKGQGHKRSGERLDRTIALYQRQGPLTTAEAFELHENLEHYAKQYEKGVLSSISAQKLGIMKPYDLVPDI
jgi:hypothetical protein